MKMLRIHQKEAVEEEDVVESREQPEVAEPASAPDVDTNNTETLPGLYRIRSAQSALSSPWVGQW